MKSRRTSHLPLCSLFVQPAVGVVPGQPLRGRQKQYLEAACKCSVVQGKGDYVIVSDTGSYNDASCTTGMYSSALVTLLDEVTDFLKKHKSKLRPVPIKVYKGH